MKTRTFALRLSAIATGAFFACMAHAQTAANTASTAPNTASTVDDSSADSLPTTVVTANRFKEDASTQTQGVSIITAQEIAQSGARNVAEALHRVLGLPIKLDLSGTGSAGIDLRGYGGAAWSNQVVIVDGLRLNEGDLSSPKLLGIPVDSIERIEVLRGAASVLYGEGASAGAIIITTKAGAGVARKTGGRVDVGVGNQGQRELALNATLAAANGFSLDAAAQSRKADNHRQNFATDSEGLNLTAQWSNDWLRLGAKAGADHNASGLPGSLTAAQYAANPWQANPASPNDWARQHNNQHGLFAQAELGSWELAADTNWRDKSYTSLNQTGTPFPYTYNYDLDARNSSLRARQQIKTSAWSNAFIVGWDESRWQRHVLGAFASTAVAHNSGWYVKDELGLPASGTQLSAGLRQERVRKTATTTPPSPDLNQSVNAWDLGIEQSLNTDWSAFARVAKGLRMANVDEFTFTAPGYTIVPQTSKDIEAGLRWKTATQKLELRAYRSRIKNEIGYDPLAPNPASWTGFGANVNFAPTTRSGLELDSRSQLSQTLALRANAALRTARFSAGTYAGNTVPLVSKKQLALGLDWQPLAQHTFNAGVNWVGAQQVDFKNTAQIPAYTTLDVGYRYTQGAWTLNTQIQNLSNKRYYSSAFFDWMGQLAVYPESGRRVSANLSYQF